jgi:two-component system response regulator FixJ
MGMRLLYVIDDDAALLRLVQRIFENEGYEVVRFTSAVAFVDHLVDARPGCILTDLRMPIFDGIDILKRVRAQELNWPLVVFSGKGDIPTAVEAMRLGAADFVEKPFRNSDLLASIDRVFEPFSLRQQQEDIDREAEALLESLTPRQLDVLRELGQGHPNKVVAHKLGISTRTAEMHRAQLMERLQARSFADLVRLAMWAQEHLASLAAHSPSVASRLNGGK